MKNDIISKKKSVRRLVIKAKAFLIAGLLCSLCIALYMILSRDNEFLDGPMSGGKLAVAVIVGLFIGSYVHWSKADKLRNEIQLDELIEQNDQL